MSKLNEEIIDVLDGARQYMTGRSIPINEGEGDAKKRTDMLYRLDTLLDFFLARRHIEECRRDENDF